MIIVVLFCLSKLRAANVSAIPVSRGCGPGFEILKQMLSEDRVVPHLPLGKIWEWLVGVACRQTGHQRLKAIHLLLRIARCCTHR